MKIIFTLLFSFVFTASVIAQPSFTTVLNPVDGYTITSQEIDQYSGSDPATSVGVNRTWDFSHLDFSSATSSSYTTYTDLSTSSASASFPNATWYTRYDSGDEIYFQNSTTNTSLIGSYGSGGFISTYSDPVVFYTIPYQYGETQNDTHLSSFTYGGTTSSTKGTSVTIFDAYGTLILPQGTYYNIARLKTIQHDTTVSDFGSGPQLSYYTDTSYSWVIPGQIDGVLELYYQYNQDGTSTPTSSIKLVYNSFSPATGIISGSGYTAAIVFPQPASSRVTVSGKNMEGTCSIVLSHLNGEKVGEQQQMASNETLTLDVSQFKKGMYILEIINEDKRYQQKLIVD